jgi:DNA modification methylase
MEATSELSSRVLKTENVNWRDFKFIQQDGFKDLESDAAHRLKASILANNFTQPFYVWEDPDNGTIFCLDGKHRTKMLEELINEGHAIPYLLPATFIQCQNKKEAAKLVTIYSSIYARVSQQGLFDFMKEYDLDFTELREQMDLPEFSIDRFEQKFDLFDINESDDQDEDIPEVNDDQVIVISGDHFRIGNHQLICCDFRMNEKLDLIFEGHKARIILTDPPYNLSADEIGNKGEVHHDDFAMGSGEMSDKEFVVFLQDIMKTSCSYSLNGSIHFIFIDWRHVWHMTEAARFIYGSPEPKQLCVWNKDIMANGSFYRAKHELCFIFKHGEEKHLSHIDLIDRIRTNVWDYPSGHSMKNPDRDQLKNHPTPKPVKMLADAIMDTTNQGDIVADFFLGSGSTLIACEKTKRKCIATEIEPKHVQTTILRYFTYCFKNGISPIFEHLNGSLTKDDFTNGKHISRNGS